MGRIKRTKNIGELKGTLLIFGGVYGNLQALQSLQQTAQELNIPASNIICTGDVVGYCAQPSECCELIEAWRIQTIAGNVEIQLREDADECGCDFSDGSRCDLFSRNWFSYAKKHTTEAALKWMHTLPDFIQFRYNGKNCIVLHGSFFETSGYIFQSNPWAEKERNLIATGADIILAGHSGLPFIQVQEAQSWLNAGVIGMPANDGNSHVWFATIRSEGSNKINGTLHSLRYDYQLASRLMNEAQLPQQYASTLITGIWDNCEILPDEETAAQGKEIIPFYVVL